MTLPTWDETEEVKDELPTWEDTEEVKEDDKSFLDSVGETLLDTGIAAGQGLTMGKSDEILAGVKTGGGLWGDYDKEASRMEAMVDEARERSPTAFTLGEIGGAMALPIPGAKARAAANAARMAEISKGVGPGLLRLGKSGIELAKYGAKEGAIAGGTEALVRSDGDVDKAVEGLTTGAGMGAAITTALPAVGKVAKATMGGIGRLGEAAKDVSRNSVMRMLGIDDAARVEETLFRSSEARNNLVNKGIPVQDITQDMIDTEIQNIPSRIDDRVDRFIEEGNIDKILPKEELLQKADLQSAKANSSLDEAINNSDVRVSKGDLLDIPEEVTAHTQTGEAQKTIDSFSKDIAGEGRRLLGTLDKDIKLVEDLRIQKSKLEYRAEGESGKKLQALNKRIKILDKKIEDARDSLGATENMVDELRAADMSAGEVRNLSTEMSEQAYRADDPLKRELARGINQAVKDQSPELASKFSDSASRLDDARGLENFTKKAGTQSATSFENRMVTTPISGGSQAAGLSLSAIVADFKNRYMVQAGASWGDKAAKFLSRNPKKMQMFQNFADRMGKRSGDIAKGAAQAHSIMITRDPEYRKAFMEANEEEE